MTLGHFGAFFSRPGRENDYLWGRLDTAERLIVLLSTPPGKSVAWFRKTGQRRRQPTSDDAGGCIDDCKAAARAIVDSERDTLKQVGDRLDYVAERATAT